MSAPAGTYFDGSWELPMQAGPVVAWPDNATQSTLYRVPYQQLAAKWKRAAFGARGPNRSFLVEETQPREEVAGIVSWDRVFAHVPPTRDDWEDYIYQAQLFLTADLSEVPIPCRARVRYDYFQTKAPESIPLPVRYRFVKAGGTFFVQGIPPVSATSERLAENATLRRWRGNIYERKQIFVPAPTFAAL